MSCRRCPHHVRHGFANTEGQIEFDDFCGLRIKQHEREQSPPQPEKVVPVKKSMRVSDVRKGAEAKVPAVKPKRYSKKLRCDKVPFNQSFDYMACDYYILTFKSSAVKNDVVPTSDYEFSELIHGGPSLAEMELL